MVPHWFHREIFVHDQGADVRTVQRILCATPTGEMNDETLARVRGFQRAHGLGVTGFVDLQTARVLGEPTTYGLLPGWFGPPIDDTALRVALHIYSHSDLETAIRRFQSAHGHYPDGILTEALAREIGD